MNFEINVARLEGKTYRHFFATAERSCTDFEKFREVIQELRAKFPEPEFQVTASKRQTVIETIE